MQYLSLNGFFSLLEISSRYVIYRLLFSIFCREVVRVDRWLGDHATVRSRFYHPRSKLPREGTVHLSTTPLFGFQSVTFRIPHRIPTQRVPSVSFCFIPARASSSLFSNPLDTGNLFINRLTISTRPQQTLRVQATRSRSASFKHRPISTYSNTFLLLLLSVLVLRAACSPDSTTTRILQKSQCLLSCGVLPLPTRATQLIIPVAFNAAQLRWRAILPLLTLHHCLRTLLGSRRLRKLSL